MKECGDPRSTEIEGADLAAPAYDFSTSLSPLLRLPTLFLTDFLRRVSFWGLPFLGLVFVDSVPIWKGPMT